MLALLANCVCCGESLLNNQANLWYSLREKFNHWSSSFWIYFIWQLLYEQAS